MDDRPTVSPSPTAARKRDEWLTRQSLPHNWADGLNRATRDINDGINQVGDPGWTATTPSRKGRTLAAFLAVGFVLGLLFMLCTGFVAAIDFWLH